MPIPRPPQHRRFLPERVVLEVDGNLPTARLPATTTTAAASTPATLFITPRAAAVATAISEDVGDHGIQRLYRVDERCRGGRVVVVSIAVQGYRRDELGRVWGLHLRIRKSANANAHRGFEI